MTSGLGSDLDPGVAPVLASGSDASKGNTNSPPYTLFQVLTSVGAPDYLVGASAGSYRLQSSLHTHPPLPLKEEQWYLSDTLVVPTPRYSNFRQQCNYVKV